jgi:hypothetical protein
MFFRTLVGTGDYSCPSQQHHEEVVLVAIKIIYNHTSIIKKFLHLDVIKNLNLLIKLINHILEIKSSKQNNKQIPTTK